MTWKREDERNNFIPLQYTNASFPRENEINNLGFFFVVITILLEKQLFLLIVY